MLMQMGDVMIENIGTIDRTARIVVGLVLLSLIFIGPQTWWGLIGVVPLATAFMRSCPAYTLLGVSTCEKK